MPSTEWILGRAPMDNYSAHVPDPSRWGATELTYGAHPDSKLALPFGFEEGEKEAKVGCRS